METDAVARLVYSVNVTLDGCCDHTQTIADNEHHEYAMTLLSGASGLVLLEVVHLDTKVFRSGVQLTRWVPGAPGSPGRHGSD